MAAAETWTPLHAWLHGGSIPDNDDDCAIVALIHGKIETTPCDVPVVVPATFVETTPRMEISVFCPAIENLPLGPRSSLFLHCFLIPVGFGQG